MDERMDGRGYFSGLVQVRVHVRTEFGSSGHTARHGTARGRRFEGGILETNLFYSVTGIVYILQPTYMVVAWTFSFTNL
jgi:hypothetical protein